MSQGSFIRSLYQATYNAANVHPIKVQGETLALSIDLPGGAQDNVPPAAVTAANNPISARVSGGRRSLGLTARKIAVRFTGTPPTGYLAGQVLTLPMINPNFASVGSGATGTYLGVAVEVVGTSPESVR